MRAPPSGPGDHEGRLDPALLEACGHAADFLDRPLSRSPQVLQRESCGCSLGSMQRHDPSPGTWLDDADRKRLAAALAAARDARVYRRLEALLLVAEGHPVAEAARRCRVNRSSVHRWLAHYRAKHEATALIDRPRSRRPRLHGPLTPQRLA